MWQKPKFGTHELDDKPHYQRGFQGTILGQNQNIRTEWSQQTPPADLGRVPAFDRQFAERNGDVAPHLGWRQDTAAPRWTPLWSEGHLIEKRKEQQFEWENQTPHGAVEDVRLFRNQLSRPPQGTAYTIPTQRPKPTRSFF